VKNKHDGVFPIGSNAKRKIPKNCDEDSDNIFSPNIEKFFEEFAEFIGQIPDASSKSRTSMVKDDVDRFFNIRFDGEEKEFLMLKSSMKALVYLDSDKEKFESLKETMNIYQILGYYLISIFPYCSEKFFREHLMLIVMICKSLNEKGDMFVDKSEMRKTTIRIDDSRKSFCEGHYVHIVSEILNLFIAELFPTLLKKFKQLDIAFEFLGFDDDHIKNLILMTKFLANWLYNNEFTDYKLEINVDL
jgi:hypothetical protein